MKAGWQRVSGQRNRSLPMVIMCPSGSSYDFYSNEDDAAVWGRTIGSGGRLGRLVLMHVFHGVSGSVSLMLVKYVTRLRPALPRLLNSTPCGRPTYKVNISNVITKICLVG
jgi:hypothetical protein